LLCVVSRPAVAQANQVTLNFYMLTANHAALGAPMQYQMTLTNTGTTSVQVGARVDLVAPDNTTFSLLNTCPTLAPGQVLGAPGTFTSSTLTSQVGTFSLKGYTTDACSGGNVVAKQKLSLTVATVPPNGIYGSIGGSGPDSAVLGYTYDFSAVTANLSAATMSVQTQVILTLTDGTTMTVKPGVLTPLNPGQSLITPLTVTTTQYTVKTGTYSVTINVLDSSANILSTDTHSFSRTNFPTGFFPPKFSDIADDALIDIPRTPPTLPPGCGSGINDFNPGNSGAAVADYDQDGFEDVFIAGEAGDNHLWHNNGNSTFTDMAVAAGIPTTAAASVSGASFADIDNDGFPDLLLLGGPQAQPILLHNNGDGTFTDITATSGLLEAVPQNNMSATWGDYDNDGYLDLFIAVHVDCNGRNPADHLFHNNGNLTFTETSQLLGGGAKLNARGLSAVFVDYNQDGRVDLYIGNDQGSRFGANTLYRNDGPDGSGGWIFTDVSASSAAGVSLASAGIAVGDFNRDGQFDFYLTNFDGVPNPANNILLQGSAAGVFTQAQGDQRGGAHARRNTIPLLAGGQAPSVTWGTGFYDFNNDGWEDIWMAGSGAGCFSDCSPVNTTVLANLRGIFLDLGNQAGTYGSVYSGVSPAAVFLDHNNDGWMDVLQAPSQAFIHLFTGQSNSNHWFQVKLIGTTSNRDAVGARLVASVGGATLLRTVINGGTYQGNSTLIQQFGLGTATQVDSLTIYWPSGTVQTLTNLPADQRMTITEP
jgi:hypothetical protein